MGINRRPQLVRIVNRTTVPKFCMYDGMPEVIEPGYELVPVLDDDGQPKTEVVKGVTVPVMESVGRLPDGNPSFQVVEFFAAEAYKRQHPLMGSQNPLSTDARDTEYLLGVIDWDDDIEYQEQSDCIELIDRSMLDEDKQAVRVVRLSGRKAVPVSVIEDRKEKANRKRAAMDRYGAMGNPFGLETRNSARW